MKTIRLSILLLVMVVMAVSCSDDDEPLIFVDDTDGIEYKLYDLYRDKYGNEGLVVYIEEGNTFKYVQVISLDETIAAWGPMGETILKGNPDSIAGSVSVGLAMLQCMKTRGIEHFPAQMWCYAKNGNESCPRTGSWRLPSFADWCWIHGDDDANIDSINKHLIALSGTPLSIDDDYWCCEEDYDGYITWTDGSEQNYDPDNRAVIITPRIRGKKDKDYWIKKNRYRIRAVKTIYLVSY